METESTAVTENMLSTEDPFMGGFIQVGNEVSLLRPFFLCVCPLPDHNFRHLRERQCQRPGTLPFWEQV